MAKLFIRNHPNIIGDVLDTYMNYCVKICHSLIGSFDILSW
jgi:hypothetical protein